MIVGPRAALGLLPRVAALALVVGTALGASATAALAAVATPAGTTTGSWAASWSWRAGSGPLPKGCSPYSGRTSAGMRWSPSLVRIVAGRLRLATAAGELAGSGVGCTGRAQRYGRLEVRARIPQGPGLVGRIALWPSTPSGGSDWSGFTLPSAEISPPYATNGCGDEAYGAAVPGRFAGAFHDYLISWSPSGFSVAVDGRTRYRDDKSFDGSRWLGISLSATGTSTGNAQLVVDRIVAYRWTGPAPAASTPTGTSTGASSGTGSRASTHTTTDSATDSASSTSTGARATVPPPGAQDAQDAISAVSGAGAAGRSAATTGSGSTAAAALTTDADNDEDGVLDAARPGGRWLVAGALVAFGVLLGVVRAARAARKRR